MPAIPESTKISLQQRLSEHARKHWPQLAGVQVRYRGTFAYVSGQLNDGEVLPLCRLRYGGSAARLGVCGLPGQQGRLRGFRPAHRRLCRRPQDALDCACGLYLNSPDS
jgi:hypothetical protein